MNVRALLRAATTVALAGLIVTLGIAPGAQAVGTLTISGHVSLGASSLSAPGGSVVVKTALQGADPASAQSGVPVDALGNFAVSNLPPGQYVQYFQYVGSDGYRSLYTQSGTTLAAAGVIPLQGFDVTNANINLPNHGVVSGHVSAGQVGGTLAAGDTLYLQWSGGPQSQTSGFIPIDPNGNYAVDLNSGRYTLTFSDLTQTYQRRSFSDQVIVGSTAITGQDIVLPLSGTIHGHVTLGTTSHSAPANSVQVGFIKDCPVNCDWTFGSPPATVDSAGNFSLPHLASGSYQLTFRYVGAAGFQGLTPRSTYQVTDTVADVTADVTLPTSGAISGTISLGTAGNLAPAGSVTAYLQGKSSALQTSVVDASGHYLFSGLPANSYVIEFDYSGSGHFADVWWPSWQSGNIATKIPVTTTQVTANAVLPVSGSISGVVRNSHGAPIPGIRVAAYGNGQRPDGDLDPTHEGVTETLTDSNGAYSFPRLAANTYQVNMTQSTLAIGMDTYLGASLSPITVTDGSVAASADAVLYVPATASGSVVCPTCTTNPGFDTHVIYVSVDRLTSAPGQPAAWAQVDSPQALGSSASFSTRGLYPGHYRFRAVMGEAVSPFQAGPYVELDIAENTHPVVSVTVQPIDLVNNPRPGTLVKTATSGSIYLVDGTRNLVALGSFGPAQDLGLPATYSVVSQNVIDSRTIDPQPLTSIITCSNGGSYLGSAGRIHPIDAPTLVGIRSTQLDGSTCLPLTSASSGTPIQGAIIVRASSGGTDYSIGHDGAKHPISSIQVAWALGAVGSVTSYPVSQYFLDTLPTGNPIIGPATLVKSPSSGAIYMTDGFDRKVPVASFSTVADLGLSTTYTIVPQSYLDSLQTAASPLTNVINCPANLMMIGASGQLWSVKSSTVANLPQSVLENSTCTQFTKFGPSFINTLFLRSADGSIYYIDPATGKKRAVYSMASLGQLSAPDAPVFLNVGTAYVASLPSGPGLLPAGYLVKASNSGTIYLSDGFTKLVPIASFQTAADASIPTGFVTVPPGDIAGLTVTPGVLTNVLVCGGSTYFAGSGKIWPIASSIVAALPTTTLSDATCSTLVHGSQSINHALFVTPPGGGTIWQVTPTGTRRAAYTFATIASLSAPDPVLYLTVGAGFIQSLPAGPELLISGMLVKSVSNGTVFLYDGGTGMFPLATFASVTDMGLPTPFLIAQQSTLDALTVYPSVLKSIVTCGGQRYLAGQGKIWPLGTAGANLPASDLPASLCAVVPKSTTALPANVFVKSPNDGNIYLLGSADKEPVASWDALVRLSGGAPGWLTVNDGWLGTVPVGPIVR